jgi:hypothetical protein
VLKTPERSLATHVGWATPPGFRLSLINPEGSSVAINFKGVAPIESAAVRTATYQTGAVGIVDYNTLQNPQFVNIIIQASALVGTPNFAYAVEWSNDGTVWSVASTADTFTAITANGNVVKQFTAKASFFRLNCTVTGGTPSLTITSTAYLS